MIAEQDTFFMCLSRFRDSTDFDRIRSIGVRSWIEELDKLTQPIDHKTVSIVDSIANYMAAQGDRIAAELLRSHIKPVIDGLQAFWETVLQQCDDQAAFAEAIKYEDGSLGRQYWHLEFTMNAISDMVSSYRSGTADGESTYQSAFEYLKLSKSETSTFKRPQISTSVDIHEVSEEETTLTPELHFSHVRMLTGFGDTTFSKMVKRGDLGLRKIGRTTVRLHAVEYAKLVETYELRKRIRNLEEKQG